MTNLNKAKNAGNFIVAFVRDNQKAALIIAGVVFVLWTALLVRLMWG